MTNPARSVLSRIGAKLGNWNDRHSHHDTAEEATTRWLLIDRIAHLLYVKGDPR